MKSTDVVTNLRRELTDAVEYALKLKTENRQLELALHFSMLDQDDREADHETWK